MTVLCDQVNSKQDKQDSMLYEQGEKLDHIITLARNVSKAAGTLQAGDQQLASKYAGSTPQGSPVLPSAPQCSPGLPSAPARFRPRCPSYRRHCKRGPRCSLK